jgi:hypothetical protein
VNSLRLTLSKRGEDQWTADEIDIEMGREGDEGKRGSLGVKSVAWPLISVRASGGRPWDGLLLWEGRGLL